MPRYLIDYRVGDGPIQQVSIEGAVSGVRAELDFLKAMQDQGVIAHALLTTRAPDVDIDYVRNDIRDAERPGR